MRHVATAPRQSVFGCLAIVLVEASHLRSLDEAGVFEFEERAGSGVPRCAHALAQPSDGHDETTVVVASVEGGYFDERRPGMR
jgi:hypothetical protein